MKINKEILLELGFKQQYFWAAATNYFIKENVVFALNNMQVETDSPNEFVCECHSIEQLVIAYKEIMGKSLVNTAPII